MTGILSGIGCGLVFRFGGSTGGTDIIYQAIEKYFHIKIGKSLFLITFGILVVSLLYLDLTHFERRDRNQCQKESLSSNY